jgi:hypothetical protein
MHELLDAALRYAARGWEVFPCHTPAADGGCSCGEAACENQGKHPRVAWKGSATTDPAIIAGWWERWPDANIGIATGARSGIVVVDADGSAGPETLAARGGTEGGPQAITGRGEHRYLKHPGVPVKNFTKRDGLDLRGDGGYVIAPPSLHRSGNRYAWVAGTEEASPPELPVWLLDLTRRDADEDVPITPIRPSLSRSARTTAYAGVALEREITRLSEAGNGTRNHSLNAAALKLGHIVGAGWLDRANVEHALLTTAMALGLPKHEATATITSGMTAGMKEPAVLDERPDTSGPGYGLKIERRVSKGEQAVEAPTERDTEWQRRGIRASELQSRTFETMHWPVASILPEGCTLLAGKPKTRKSWLALGLAVDVALGHLTLGGLETRRGHVLYLDLESNQRRMQARLRAMLGGTAWPDNLHIFTEWPRGAAGIVQLDDWMAVYQDTSLVIADILQNIRPARVKNANPYDEDYEAVKPLTAWGEKHHAGVLALHHTRKAKADDVFDEISGSTGLVAGAAGMWILGRMPNSTEYVLTVRGRDIQLDDDMALGWDDYTCRFMWTGSAEERSISQERQAVLSAMTDEGEYTPKDLALILGRPVTSVNKSLLHLFNDRFVEKTGFGKYVKIMKPQTYGLRVQTHPSVQSLQSVQSVQNTDEAVSNSAGVGPTLQASPVPPAEFVHGIGTQQNGAQERNSAGSAGFSPPPKRTADFDHDQRRLTEVQAALLIHDFKTARRAAATIRGRKTHDAVEEMIDTAEAEDRP